LSKEWHHRSVLGVVTKWMKDSRLTMGSGWLHEPMIREGLFLSLSLLSTSIVDNSSIRDCYNHPRDWTFLSTDETRAHLAQKRQHRCEKNTSMYV
jgi:hypothetical protein